MEVGSKHAKEGRIPPVPRWAQDLGEAFRIAGVAKEDYVLKLGSVSRPGEVGIREEEERWSNFSNCILALRDFLPNELYIGEKKPYPPIKFSFGSGWEQHSAYSLEDTINYFLPKDGKVLTIDRRVQVDPSYVPGTSEYQGISKIIFPPKKGLPYGVSIHKRRLSVSEQTEALQGIREQLKDTDKEEFLREQEEKNWQISQKFAEEREHQEEFFAQQKKMRILNILKIFKQHSQIKNKLPDLIPFYLGGQKNDMSDMQVVLDTEKEDIFRAPMVREEKKTFLGRKKVIKKLDLERKEPSRILDWHAVEANDLIHFLPQGDGKKYVSDMYFLRD